MIPDVLISKYLDGELSEAEDRELRGMLSVNQEAKEAFDTAVLIHIAMRCEGEISVPEDLRSPIFDAVDAMAVEMPSHVPGEVPATAPTRSTIRTTRTHALRRALTATLALLLGWCIPLSDRLPSMGQLLGSVAPAEFSVPLPTNVTNGSSERDMAERIAVPSGPVCMADTVAQDMANEVPLQAPTSGNVAEEPPSKPFLPSEPTVPLRAVLGSTSAAGMSAAEQPRRQEPALAIVQPAEIVLFSSYGQSMARKSGLNVTSMSAGVGYMLSPAAVVGVELGTMSYSTVSSTTSSPRPMGASASHALHPGNGGLSKLTPSVPGGNYRTESYSTELTDGSIWGGAFVQYRVFNAGILGLNSRVGMGALNDGMLAYGRMQADVRLFSAASLFVGAEARTAPFRRGAVGGQAQDGEYETLFLITYGLQVRF